MRESDHNRAPPERSSTDPATVEKVKIRPFPYPYKAALAICNDLDCITSFQELKAIHDVLNGRKETPCGPGLGLEIGDSFHFYSVHPEQDDSLSYFEGTGTKIAGHAAALREGIEAGLLDTLHTWGNFSQKGGFFRRHAERALKELDRYNLRVPVWTNHGDIHNFQNIGRSDSLGDLPARSSQRGNRSEVLEYHLDLTRRAGVRYVWVKELTRIVGQERSLEPEDWLENGINLGRNIIKGFLKRGQRAEVSHSLQISNKLLRPKTLRDGSILYEMLRFGSFLQDGSDHLPELLTVKNLRRLVETGGAMILYTHLGKGRPSPEKPFSPESYSTLARLACRVSEGEIWVTTTARLCRYVEMRQRLKLDVVAEAEGAKATVSFKKMGDLPSPDLSGLTFYLSGADRCELHINGEVFQLDKNPADHTGEISFSMPIEPLQYCWE